ncbi:MAG: OmpA family protein [Gemmatimonadota bacterium]
MRTTPTILGLLLCTLFLALPQPADAQLRRLRDAAKRAAERETSAIVDRLVSDAIRCAVDDPRCTSQAEADGKEVIYVDADGEIITDDDGVPITDREEAAKRSPALEAPGEGLWANYDFVPGDRIVFYDDFQHDRVGDFPRRFELIMGNWDVVESGERRYLRGTSGGSVKIPLPETLPDRFTMEFDASLEHGNGYIRITTAPAYHGPDRTFEGSAVSLMLNDAGLLPVAKTGPEARTRHDHRFSEEGTAPFRVMADGDYMKVYVGEKRVANVPNAVFPRSDALYIHTSSASEGRPTLIGPIRIAAGGLDLYSRLEAEGRVSTQGILFAVDSDQIRPESTPTLEEIGTMLADHPDLRLAVEGHTDADGDEAHNLDLSERRAQAVKEFLMERYGIDGSRLEAHGYGESQPVADNTTPEGKQQNRRVDLVRLP